MTVIRHNVPAMNSRRHYNANTGKLNKTLKNLATGYRINRASDDAAGLGISEKMRAMITGLNQGVENVSNGVSLCQTADGALIEVHSMLNRLEELTVQAANGTYSDRERQAIQDEVDQLKSEINRISKNTNFNGIPLFYSPYHPSAEGTPGDLEIFNASYDASSGTATYGGVIFRGERYTWDAIDPDMVDPATGNFVPGTYTLNTSKGKLTFHCKDGSSPPQINREYSFGADYSGVQIDGETVNWNRITNENGNAIVPPRVKPGDYSFDFYGTYITFSVPDGDTSIDDVIKGLQNKFLRSAIWTSSFAGTDKKTAVDITQIGSGSGRNIQINNAFKSFLDRSGDSFEIIVRASVAGIWLEDKDGNQVGDVNSWPFMGIPDWDEDDYISESKVYTYKDSTLGIEFNYRLLNETSLDSIIDGLDGVKITNSSYITDDTASMSISRPSNIAEGILNYERCDLTLQEQAALGRDFGIETQNLATEQLSYDPATRQYTLTYRDTGGNEVLKLTGNAVPTESILKQQSQIYADYIEKLAVKQALSGSTTLITNIGELVGAGNITSDRYFSDTVTITPGMTLSGGSSNEAAPLVPGSTYPCAFIDFSGMGTAYQLEDLLDMGFNSTCKTCTAHYSISFVDGGTTQTTSNGYGYSLQNNGSNYTLQVDISTFGGITNGSDFTSALIEVLDEGNIDSHFTQYAADGGKLYIADNRSSSSPAPAATFEPHVHSAPSNIANISFGLTTSDGRSMNMAYSYDLSNIKNDIKAELIMDAGGDYVKNADGKYVPYRPGDFTGLPAPDRYRLEVTNSFNADTYVQNAITDITSNSNITLSTNGFAYATVEGDERPNLAVVTKFDSVIHDSEASLWIQASANSSFDGTWINLYQVNVSVLGLSRLNMSDAESASQGLSMIQHAIEKTSFVRANFGNKQNQLDHMKNNNISTHSNLQASESRIRDTDMATTMMQHVKNNILLQASQSMLAQANELTSGVLNLFMQL